MAITDEQLMQMLASGGKANAQALQSTDPSLAQPVQATPPPAAAQPQAQPQGYLGAAGKAFDALGNAATSASQMLPDATQLGETAASASRSTIQGVGDAALNFHVLARDALDSLGITDEDKTGNLKKQILADREKFLANEAAMGHGTVSKIASTGSRIGAELAGGYALAGGAVLNSLNGVAQAGTLLPSVAGQAATSMIAGAAENTAGSLTDKLGSGGQQAALSIAANGIQALSYLRKVQAPGAAEGLSTKAAMGVDSRNPAVQGGEKLVKNIRAEVRARNKMSTENMYDDTTLVDKFVNSTEKAKEAIEVQRKAAYAKSVDAMDEYGKMPITSLLKKPEVAKLLQPGYDVGNRKEAQGVLKTFLQDLVKKNGDIKPSEFHRLYVDVVSPLAKKGTAEVKQFVKAFKDALVEYADTLPGKNMTGTLGDGIRKADQFFSKVVSPVRKDLNMIAKHIEGGQVDAAVDVFSKSANKVKVFRAIKSTLGESAQESFGDMVVLNQINKNVVGHVSKHGDILNPAAIHTAFVNVKKTPIWDMLHHNTKQNMEVFMDYMSKDLLSKTSGASLTTGWMKGSMASIPALYSNFVNTAGGRILLTRAAEFSAGSLARQRFYKEFTRIAIAAHANNVQNPKSSRVKGGGISDAELDALIQKHKGQQ